jgi:hypothetical protein
MGWVHGHRRRGAYLALAALLLQIAISFGHVDVDGAVVGDHLTLGKTDFDGAHKIVVAAKTSRQGPTQSSDEGYCPICASIFLVSTSFVSTAPQLPVPEGFYRISHSVTVARGFSPPLRLAFRSRAPPTA